MALKQNLYTVSAWPKSVFFSMCSLDPYFSVYKDNLQLGSLHMHPCLLLFSIFKCTSNSLTGLQTEPWHSCYMKYILHLYMLCLSSTELKKKDKTSYKKLSGMNEILHNNISPFSFEPAGRDSGSFSRLCLCTQADGSSVVYHICKILVLCFF